MLPVALSGVGKLQSVELWEAQTELQASIETATRQHAKKPVLYVRVLADDAEGWGEVGALEDASGRDPSLDQVRRVLEDKWIPTLGAAARSRGGRTIESHTVSLLGGSDPRDLVACAAIEMAILDAELRSQSLSVSAWLGQETRQVAFGGLVGLRRDSSTNIEVEQAARLLESGASRIRVKVAPGYCVEPLAAIRSLDSGVALHGDANESFDPSFGNPASLDELHALDSLELTCLEQPYLASNLTGSASLSEEIETPVCLDESISSLRAARDAIRYEAAQALCLKPSRLGGVRVALGVLSQAEEAGLACFFGGLFETGLGRALLGSLAALPAATLISDVGAPSLYLTEDPCALAGPLDRAQPLYLEPGVGPWPQEAYRRLAYSWTVGDSPRTYDRPDTL